MKSADAAGRALLPLKFILIGLWALQHTNYWIHVNWFNNSLCSWNARVGRKSHEIVRIKKTNKKHFFFVDKNLQNLLNFSITFNGLIYSLYFHSFNWFFFLLLFTFKWSIFQSKKVSCNNFIRFTFSQINVEWTHAICIKQCDEFKINVFKYIDWLIN